MSARCPFCELEAPRPEVHAHMVQTHADRMEAWRDAASGRMHYRVECPECGERYEKRIKPRSRDPRFLEEFAGEVRMVAFDMLLNHVEAEHGDGAEALDEAEEALPAAGPGGGRGRPGAPGVPLPPGMGEEDTREPAFRLAIETDRQRREHR